MELAFEQKQRSCLKRTAHLSLAQEQTQELIIPDAMPDAARTLICYAEPELQSKTSRAGSLLVTGNLRASCLYADEAGGLQLLTTDVPFTLKLESSDLLPYRRILASQDAVRRPLLGPQRRQPTHQLPQGPAAHQRAGPGGRI